MRLRTSNVSSNSNDAAVDIGASNEMDRSNHLAMDGHGEPREFESDSSESTFQPEKIVNSRTISRGRLEYEVKWIGFGDSENTWISEDQVATFRDSQILSLYLRETNLLHAQLSAKKIQGTQTILIP